MAARLWAWWLALAALVILASACERSYSACRRNATSIECPEQGFFLPPCTTQRASFANVTHLDLGFNQITFLLKGSFMQFPKLQSLKLQHNDVTRISRSAFLEQTALTTLDLSHNAIVNISVGVFTRTRSLERLDLSFNKISRLYETLLYNITTLKSLNLSHNEVVFVMAKTLVNQTGLRTLDLSYNNITRILREHFNDLPVLERLDLSNNRITLVSSRSFSGLGSLKFLDLSNNRVTTLLDRAFANLVSLTHLDLSRNELFVARSIPDSTKLTTLSFLNLSMNRLPSFHKDAFFQGFAGLKTLDLSFNQLTTVKEDLFDNSTGIEHLYLQSNNLSFIGEKTFVLLSKLRTLALYPNPLDCCGASWAEAMQDRSLLCGIYSIDLVAAPALHCARCGYPRVLEGVPIKDTTVALACQAVRCPREKPTPPQYAISDPNCTLQGFNEKCPIACDASAGFSHSTKPGREPFWTCTSIERWVTGIVCIDNIMKFFGTSSRMLNRAYQISRGPESFEFATRVCNQRGGNLVSLEDVFEARYVSSFYERQRLVFDIWIGLRLNSTTSLVQWSTGAAVSYAPAAFDATRLTPEAACISMRSRNKVQTWSPQSCARAFRFVCEYPFSVVRLARTRG